MTSLIIGLWVGATVSVTPEPPKGVPPSDRAMRKQCATVNEGLIQRVHDYTLGVSAPAPPSVTPTRGAVITKIRQWVKDEKLAEQIPDACLVEIVRLAYTRGVEDAKKKQEVEATGAKLAAWAALTDLEKRCLLSSPAIAETSLSLGQVGPINWPVTVIRAVSNEVMLVGLHNIPEVVRTYRDNGFNTEPTLIETVKDHPTVHVLIHCKTDGFVTGSRLNFAGYFEVFGTQSINTTRGIRQVEETIFELRQVTIDGAKLSTITPPPGVTIENYRDGQK